MAQASRAYAASLELWPFSMSSPAPAATVRVRSARRRLSGAVAVSSASTETPDVSSTNVISSSCVNLRLPWGGTHLVGGWTERGDTWQHPERGQGVLAPATPAPWTMLCWFVSGCAGMYWFVCTRLYEVCIELYWFVLVYTGLYRAMLNLTALYWAVLVCIKLYRFVLGQAALRRATLVSAGVYLFKPVHTCLHWSVLGSMGPHLSAQGSTGLPGAKLMQRGPVCLGGGLTRCRIAARIRRTEPISSGEKPITAIASSTAR